MKRAKMGRPKIAASALRRRIVSVRVTEKQRTELLRRARRAGKTLTGYILNPHFPAED